MLIVVAVWAGLVMTPPDYLQGETVRILYIHVPAAWLGMGGWSGIALASLSLIVWRHPLAQVAGGPSPGRGGLHRLVSGDGVDLGRPTWGRGGNGTGG